MGNLDLFNDHMSSEGSLAVNCNECHAYSMRGSVGQKASRVSESGQKSERTFFFELSLFFLTFVSNRGSCFTPLVVICCGYTNIRVLHHKEPINGPG